MFKEARKPSGDPAQEKLRQNKALWNKEVSSFINDLIHFKKTMNGAPSKFFQEKGTIKEPIPADPATIIGVLSGDFQEIATKGNSIIQQQLDYSKTRRKAQPKQLNLPLGQPAPKTPAPAPAPAPDLSKQLALPNVASLDSDLIKLATRLEVKYSLEKEASNKISRFFTRLFNPTVGFGNAADIRRARMEMLNACADAYKDLGKFQVQVVKSSKESITESHKKLQDVWNKWTLVSRAYAIYKNSKSTGAPDKGGSIESQVKTQDEREEKALESLDRSVKDFEAKSKGLVVAPTEEALEQIPEEPIADPDLSPLYRLENVKNMVADYRKYQEFIPQSKGIGSGYLSELDAAVDKFIASRGKKISPDFDQSYEKSIRHLNQEFGTAGNSFKDIATQLRARVKTPAKPVPIPPPVTTEVTPEKVASAQIEKVAQDFLKKWVGKTMHQLSIFDKTSAYRLNCYKLAAQLRKDLDQIMNVLEKGLDEGKLDPLIKDANSQILSLRGMMRSLHLATPPDKKHKAVPGLMG